jgi:hypothetical protein
MVTAETLTDEEIRATKAAAHNIRTTLRDGRALLICAKCRAGVAWLQIANEDPS